MWEQSDRDRGVVPATFLEEGAQRSVFDRPAGAGRLREHPVQVGGIGLDESQLLQGPLVLLAEHPAEQRSVGQAIEPATEGGVG
jgi:hypothetical protein